MTMTADAPPTAEFLPACPIGRVHPDPINPRTHVDVDDDFIASCAAGIHEPLIVRPDQSLPTLMGDAEDFLIVAGERRYTAATAASLDTIPVIVRFDLADDADALEVMIIENGQRESLPPLDEARAYATLVEKGRTQRDIAAAVGREQGTVSKRLSLLKLPTRAQQLLDDQRITVKTALGMTGLAKDNGRLSKVLDYAAQNSWADDADIARVVFSNLEQLKRDAERAKDAKKVEKKLADLRAGKLEEKTEDDLDGTLVQCDADDPNVTVFVVCESWNGDKEVEYYRARDDDDSAPIPEPRRHRYEPDPESEAELAARKTRIDLIMNLIGDGYPGDEAVLALIVPRFFRSELRQIDDYESEDFFGPPDDDEEYEVWEQRIADKLGGPTVRGAWAVTLIANENQWGAEQKLEQLQVLMEHGYTPTLPDERALLGDTVPDGDFEPELDDAEPAAAVVDTADPTVQDDDEPAPQPWTGYRQYTKKNLLARIAAATTEELDRVVAWEKPGTKKAEWVLAAVEERRNELADATTDTDDEDEPFKGYDAFPLTSIVNNVINNDETTIERIQAILDYETENRADSRILDAARARLDELAVA